MTPACPTSPIASSRFRTGRSSARPRPRRHGEQTSDSVGSLLRGDFPFFGFDRLPEFLKRVAEVLDQTRLRRAVGQLLDQLQETFHLWNLAVFHDQEFLLIQGGGEELVSHGGDRRLSGPKAQELVQVESEAKDNRQDDEEEEQKDFHFIEPKLRELLPQDQREDAVERQDREDDPEDAHTQVPAVQPLRGSDLLTLGAHSGPQVDDITREGIFPAVAKQTRQVSLATAAARIPTWRTARQSATLRGSLLLHVPRALELNRLLAGAVHLRDQIDRVLEIAVVRGNPPETEHDEGDRDGQGERPAGHRAGGVLNRILNSRHEHEEADRDAHDQEHRPQHGQDDPPSNASLGAERRGHAFP